MKKTILSLGWISVLTLSSFAFGAADPNLTKLKELIGTQSIKCQESGNPNRGDIVTIKIAKDKHGEEYGSYDFPSSGWANTPGYLQVTPYQISVSFTMETPVNDETINIKIKMENGRPVLLPSSLVWTMADEEPNGATPLSCRME